MIRLRELVKSTRFSTTLRTPMAEIMPYRMKDRNRRCAAPDNFAGAIGSDILNQLPHHIHLVIPGKMTDFLVISLWCHPFGVFSPSLPGD